MSNPTKDDIYAYALSKTLTKVSSPATVGLYSSCQDRINMILRQMEVCMDKEAVRIEEDHKEKPHSAKPSFSGFLALMGRLLFYRPIWKNQQYPNVRFIHVHFSAWHFAGSDLLWAGLAIRLFQAMQMNFGKLHLVLYRVAQHDEEEEVKRRIVEDVPDSWRSKKICCCPLWFLVLSILFVPLVILVFVLTFGFPKPEIKPDEEVDKRNGQVAVLEGLIIAALGVPAASVLRFTFMMGKNFIFSQEMNIKKGMDNERVSSQLGFMNEVRKEMWFLTRFIQFMETFERRRIRVVLKITSLDRCTPKKIVAVLDAINILLSDEESPFISILAVNPDVLMQKVNFADGCFSKEDRAYALLNRIVTLAFTVPPLCDDLKRSLFYSLTSNSVFPEGESMRQDEHRTGKPKKTSSSDETEVDIELEESNALINKTSTALDVKENEVDVKDEEVESLIKSILTSNEKNINKYMVDDATSMRRVINSIRVTAIIMKGLGKKLQPGKVAAWVVLANQWPCRLSWIIQCVEDAQQRADIDGQSVTNIDDSKTLWEVFSKSRAELYVMSAQIEDLLEQDGDPEMFEKFLKDFEFTVKDLKTFEMVTVNLDHSIRKELAQIRGTSRLRDSGWMRDLAPLPLTTIIKMSTQDICNEFKRMNYPGMDFSKYIDKVKSNYLNGLALLFGDTDKLKDLLGMTFGEWATFKLHFLGLPAHLRPQYKTMQLSPSHPLNQLWRFNAHVANHYSPNPSLVNSCM
ncbi:NTPase KAP family P-loop domain-containing protein 1 isoform X1 [Lates calcarifer]|uniref:NTPase KAP family P-loop domain-containing protein 1 isoform X1 n=2 Tax=Lates calcarifer TaxID=8187 RepID=A0AAJ7PUV8_LATCA|nr:NTPase KAP family P-loop domain-containing protein 1 isoform X1 [Lates calcarifer]XP_050930223.1 NTPase KAP family P-loop domain-containing protein 1 isoform X1 [Lates calcarifer]